MPGADAATSAAPAARAKAPTYSFIPSKLRTGTFLKWLRRTHGWLGLWGGAIALLFGATGILLNHRAILKIPAAKVEETRVQLKLAAPPASPDALAAWLRGSLSIDRPPVRTQVEKPRAARFAGGDVALPARWEIRFESPQTSLRAEYWVGNAFVEVKRGDGNVFSVLTRLHMATGVNAAWVLFADAIAGSLIMLALTGVLLWTRLHGPRLLAAGLAAGGLAAATTLALGAM